MTNHSAWRAIGLALAVTLSGCGGGGDAPPTELPQSLAVAAPSTAEPGAEVAFSSDLAPPPSGLTWQWRFGDGGTSDDLQPSHSWSSPGQYEVTLTVSNEAGQTRQATQTVTVGRFSLIKDAACTGPGNTGWCWQRPKPTGNAVLDIHFQGTQLGWAVDNAGQILNTRDGGATWTRQDSGVTTSLTQVRFADALNGWAVSDSSTVLHTSDGGSHWQAQATGAPLFFGGTATMMPISATTAVWFSQYGNGRFTLDAGETWAALPGGQQLITPSGTLWQSDGIGLTKSSDFGKTNKRTLDLSGQNRQLLRLGFPDDQHGWALLLEFGKPQPPYYTLVFLTTSDAADTGWQTRSTTGLGEFFNLGLFQLYADGKGWAVSSGQLLRSVDGGSNWSPLSVTVDGQPVNFGAAQARDGDTLWTQLGNSVTLTRDGGATWTTLRVSAESPFGFARTLLFGGDGALWLNYGSRWYRSPDGGATWQRIFGGDPLDDFSPLSALWFFDAADGLAVSAGGWLVETSNGGLNWNRRSLTNNGFNFGSARMQFGSAGQGWLLLNGTAIHRTTDRGASWSTPLMPTTFSNLVDFSFVDATQGWALSADGSIYRSQDSGGNWETQSTLATFGMSALRFANASVGVAVGAAGQLARTTDGGAHWKWRPSGVTSSLSRVVFQGEDKAWAVGSAGTLIRSTNGGLGWTRLPLPTVLDLKDIAFADADHGWIVGDGGTVLATVDGGRNWTLQPSGTALNLGSVFAVDARTAWMVGANGSVLVTATGGY